MRIGSIEIKWETLWVRQFRTIRPGDMVKHRNYNIGMCSCYNPELGRLYIEWYNAGISRWMPVRGWFPVQRTKKLVWINHNKK